MAPQPQIIEPTLRAGKLSSVADDVSYTPKWPAPSSLNLNAEARPVPLIVTSSKFINTMLSLADTTFVQLIVCWLVTASVVPIPYGITLPDSSFPASIPTCALLKMVRLDLVVSPRSTSPLIVPPYICMLDNLFHPAPTCTALATV